MKDSIELINYIESIMRSACNKFVSLGYEDYDFSKLLYAMIVDDKLSEFDKDFYNCDDLTNLNKSILVKKYMYAVYYLVQYSEMGNHVSDDYISELLMTYNVSDSIIDELFMDEGIGIELTDVALTYLDMTPARKKRMTSKLSSDENLDDVMENNVMMKILYSVNSNLTVSQEEYLIDDICNIYDYIDLKYDNEVDENVKYNKLKKYFLLNGLVSDLVNNNDVYCVKKFFSMMVKNVFAEVYYSKLNGFRKIEKDDDKFFELIVSNELSYDELFSKFINDIGFSNYLLKSFYINNLDVESFELENRVKVLTDDGLIQKVKKYEIG